MTQAEKWIKAEPKEPATKVARRSLKQRLKTTQHYLPLAAEQPEDVEHVHQVRVWSRRAQAALELYHDLLPKSRAAWIKKQLRRMRKATNGARDDDVFAERLAAEKQDAPTALLLEKIRSHRRAAQQAVVDVYHDLKKKDFEIRCRELIQRVRLRKGEENGQPPRFDAWARERFRPFVEDFFNKSQANLADIAALHEFRISGKKLRYAMELLFAAFSSETRQEAYAAMEALQEKLGAVNDHATAQTLIRRWLADAATVKEVECLEAMLDEEQEMLEKHRREFLFWWTPEQSKSLRAAFYSLTPCGAASKLAIDG